MASKQKTTGLGRGLDAIFEIEGMSVPARRSRSIFDEIEITRIIPNPRQPRTMFDEESLSELAGSIRSLGVIQPITVKKEPDGKYLIISGERRYRASQLAGLETIPAYVREVDDQTLLEMALVENIQRQDLNAVDIALSLRRLIDECDLTQDELADRVGKKRSTVANYMRLLKLPAEVQLAVKEDLISMGHARAIAGLSDGKSQQKALRKVLKDSLSVRQTEELVAQLSAGSAKKKRADEEYPESYTRLVEYLEKFFNQNIAIRKNAKGGGRIVIDFASDDDVEGFINKFGNL